MEIMAYVLLVLLSAVQLFIGIFLVEDHTLLPFTVVGLALAVLILLIRIYYTGKKLKMIETKGSSG